MENTLEDLSLSTLRNLLIVEVKRFIVCLDEGTQSDLQNKKLFLRKIYEIIQKKEMAENLASPWGENPADAQPTKPI